MTIEAKQISVNAQGISLLKDLSCVINPGELTVIIGPNGSGKTSLIRTLSGELTPSHGQVCLDNIPLENWSNKALAKRRSVLPQHAVLDFPFKVNEVVKLGRSPFLRDAKKDGNLVNEAMAKFELIEYAERPYTTLSGGERQRVHLARAWAQICDFNSNQPGFLLLDEPTAALDLKHQRDLMSLLVSSAREHNLGVVAALHDLNAAAHYADTLLLLKHGQLVASGNGDEVLTPSNIEHVYEVSVEFLHYHASTKQPIAIPLNSDQ